MTNGGEEEDDAHKEKEEHRCGLPRTIDHAYNRSNHDDHHHNGVISAEYRRTNNLLLLGDVVITNHQKSNRWKTSQCIR